MTQTITCWFNVYETIDGETVSIACGPRSRDEAVRQGVHALMLSDGCARLIYRVRVTAQAWVPPSER